MGKAQTTKDEDDYEWRSIDDNAEEFQKFHNCLRPGKQRTLSNMSISYSSFKNAWALQLSYSIWTCEN